MTLKEAIDKFDAITPNQYTNDQKTDWINTLEQMIQTEILHTAPYITTQDETGAVTKLFGSLTAYTYANNQTTDLSLTDTPFTDIYGIYLTSMVYFAEEEWGKYANARGMFNARYLDAAKYHSRNYGRIQENKVHNLWG